MTFLLGISRHRPLCRGFPGPFFLQIVVGSASRTPRAGPLIAGGNGEIVSATDKRY
jgi:hypothetical protein